VTGAEAVQWQRQTTPIAVRRNQYAPDKLLRIEHDRVRLANNSH
jgi:hypothetical protein